jgi:hypothetical protein
LWLLFLNSFYVIVLLHLFEFNASHAGFEGMAATRRWPVTADQW